MLDRTMKIYRILLIQEAIRGEKIAWIFRWALYGLVFVLAGSVYLSLGRVVGLYGMAIAIVMLAYNAFLTPLIRKRRNFTWIRYASVCLDVMGLTMYNFLDTVFTSYLVPVSTASLLLYPAILFVAALRLDRGLIVFATLFSVLTMNLLFAFAWPSMDPTLTSQIVSADIMGQVYRTIYLLLCGFFMLMIPDTVTRLLRNQEQLYKKSKLHYDMAHKDNLTGLANRRRLDDYLPVELELVKMEGRKLAVVYMDLDGFKPINDSHGHETGDLVLQEFAKRLSACTRGSDLAVRMGGDEFVLVFRRVESLESCEHMMERITAILTQEIEIENQRLKIGLSYGIALYPDDALSQDTLLEYADHAMFTAKKGRR